MENQLQGSVRPHHGTDITFRVMSDALDESGVLGPWSPKGLDLVRRAHTVDFRVVWAYELAAGQVHRARAVYHLLVALMPLVAHRETRWMHELMLTAGRAVGGMTGVAAFQAQLAQLEWSEADARARSARERLAASLGEDLAAFLDGGPANLDDVEFAIVLRDIVRQVAAVLPDERLHELDAIPEEFAERLDLQGPSAPDCVYCGAVRETDCRCTALVRTRRRYLAEMPMRHLEVVQLRQVAERLVDSASDRIISCSFDSDDTRALLQFFVYANQGIEPGDDLEGDCASDLLDCVALGGLDIELQQLFDLVHRERIVGSIGAVRMLRVVVAVLATYEPDEDTRREVEWMLIRAGDVLAGAVDREQFDLEQSALHERGLPPSLRNEGGGGLLQAVMHFCDAVDEVAFGGAGRALRRAPHNLLRFGTDSLFTPGTEGRVNPRRRAAALAAHSAAETALAVISGEERDAELADFLGCPAPGPTTSPVGEARSAA